MPPRHFFCFLHDAGISTRLKGFLATRGVCDLPNYVGLESVYHFDPNRKNRLHINIYFTRSL